MTFQNTKQSGYCKTASVISFTSSDVLNLRNRVSFPLPLALLPPSCNLVDGYESVQSESLPRIQNRHYLCSKPCHSIRHHATHCRTNPISFTQEHPLLPSFTSSTFPTAPYAGEGKQSIFVTLGLPPEEEIRVNLPSERCQYELGSYDDPWIKANIKQSSFYNYEDHDLEPSQLLPDSGN